MNWDNYEMVIANVCLVLTVKSGHLVIKTAYTDKKNRDHVGYFLYDSLVYFCGDLELGYIPEVRKIVKRNKKYLGGWRIFYLLSRNYNHGHRLQLIRKLVELDKRHARRGF